ncbi:hypothetical protein AB2N04_13235 [Nitratireductor sp. GISD-1A_MAKvit]|uniref:hypothetical protein n=1 Tax=Nitratireductor sp. GISD-1A_MAKvit TaxID=3234198 RepID=UPI0034672ED1
MRPFFARLRKALPSPRVAFAGAALWGGVMGANAVILLSRQLEWQAEPRALLLGALFALGGALAFPAGHFMQALVARNARAETRFSAAFLAFAIATLAITAALYAMQYRLYYAQWHGAFLSPSWIIHFVFTTAGALYQFAVLGLRIYFPWGLAALFALSLVYAVRPR